MAGPLSPGRLAGVLAACVLAPATPAQSQSASNLTSRVVEGRIVAADASAAPVTRARIAVVVSGRTQSPVLSDMNGQFAAAAPEGAFRLRVMKPGFLTQELPVAASTTDTLDVRLVRGGVITGRALMATGEPLVAISVAIKGVRGSPTPASASGQTDDLGQFRIAGIAPGQYAVSLGAMFTCADNGCKVVEAAGTEVEVRAGEEAAVILTSQAVDRIPNGQTRVVIPAPPNAMPIAPFQASIRGAITGAVVDEAGEPIEGLTVRALRAKTIDGRTMLEPLPPSSTRRTDDRGRYRLFGLLPGTYYVVASDPPAVVSPGGQPLHVSPHVFYPGRPSAGEALSLRVDGGAEVAGIDLAFAPYRGATVTGQAHASTGRLVSGIAILAGSARSWAPSPEPRATAVKDGKFEFLHVPPGDYAVQVIGWRTWEVSEEFGVTLVNVSGDARTPVAVTTSPPWRITGRIRFEGAQSEAALESVALRSLIADADLTPALPVEPALTERVEIRRDGTFTMSGLLGTRRFTATAPPGWWLEAVTIDGMNAADEPFAFGPGGGLRSNVEVVFARGAASVTGRVLDAGGERMAGAHVLVLPSDAARLYSRSRYVGHAVSNTEGRFAIEDLPPGEYSVVAVDGVLIEGDWYDPAVLNALLAASQRVSLTQGGNAIDPPLTRLSP